MRKELAFLIKRQTTLTKLSARGSVFDRKNEDEMDWNDVCVELEKKKKIKKEKNKERKKSCHHGSWRGENNPPGH